MPVYQEKNKSKWTKDGRSWYFLAMYTTLDGARKQKESKKYYTKKEAQIAERQFLENCAHEDIDSSNLTFKDLKEKFFDFKKNKISEGTLNTYHTQSKFLEWFDKFKISSLNVQKFDKWQSYMYDQENTISFKNDVLTLLKSILNYGIKRLSLDLNKFYSNIIPFEDPNSAKKEMEFYTYKEYCQFIAVEEDLLFKALFETLYFLGLRKGELRGLQWKFVDFEKRRVQIKFQIPSRLNVSDYELTKLKTKASYRILPIPNRLYEWLKALYNQNKQYTNFNDDWFIFGNVLPISKEKIKDRKDRNISLANIKYIRVHDFRHSCASFLINNGASIVLVAKYLGHSNIQETLKTYAHMYKDELDAMTNIIDQLQKNTKI